MADKRIRVVTSKDVMYDQVNQCEPQGERWKVTKAASSKWVQNATRKTAVLYDVMGYKRNSIQTIKNANTQSPVPVIACVHHGRAAASLDHIRRSIEAGALFCVNPIPSQMIKRDWKQLIQQTMELIDIITGRLRITLITVDGNEHQFSYGVGGLMIDEKVLLPAEKAPDEKITDVLVADEAGQIITSRGIKNGCRPMIGKDGDTAYIPL